MPRGASSIYRTGFVGLTLLAMLAQSRPLDALRSLFQWDAFEKLNLESATTMESWLISLPEEFRRNYVLLHSSRSLSQASPEAPRVLLRSADSKTIIAFPADSSGEKGRTVEILHYNLSAQKYETAEIKFEKDKIHIQKDPPRCYSCHASDEANKELHPIWESYDFWADAYGSDHSRPVGIEDLSSETVNFEKLKSVFGLNPRLNWLPGFSDLQLPRGHSEDYSGQSPSLAQRNTMLTEGLGRWNGDRIAVRVSEALAKDPARWYDLLRVYRDPMAFKNQLLTTEQKKFESFEERIRLSIDRSVQNRIERFLDLGNFSKGLTAEQKRIYPMDSLSVRYLAPVLWFYKTRLKVSVDDWAMTPNSGRFEFSTGLAPIHYYVLHALLNRWPMRLQLEEKFGREPVDESDTSDIFVTAKRIGDRAEHWLRLNRRLILWDNRAVCESKLQ